MDTRISLHALRTSLPSFRRGRTRRQRRQDYASQSLVQTPKHLSPPESSGRSIRVESLVVGRLKPGLEGVQRVDEQVDGEGSKGTGDEDVGAGRARHWPVDRRGIYGFDFPPCDGKAESIRVP